MPAHTPTAEISRPEQKQTSEVNIAHRGPLRSTVVPSTAAESPSITMPSWKGRADCVPVIPRDFSRGVLKTLQA